MVVHLNTTAKRMKTILIKFKNFHKLPTHNRSEEMLCVLGWKEDTMKYTKYITVEI
jgi:hypothetical protein